MEKKKESSAQRNGKISELMGKGDANKMLDLLIVTRLNSMGSKSATSLGDE